MNKPIKITMLTIGLVILFGAPTIAWSSTFQTSEVYSFTTGEPTAGGGTLNRDDDSIHLRVSMAGLDKKSTYSAWFIIFNNPDACGGMNAPLPCMGPDLDNPDVGGAVINAGGFVTGTDGTGYFVGELAINDHPDGVCCGPGELGDSMLAEVHILIQTHSKYSIGDVSLQMSVPNAACNPDCADQLFLVFLPPAP